jgi:hypothetical protein
MNMDMDMDTDRDRDGDMDMDRDEDRDEDRAKDRDEDSKENLAVKKYIISSYSNAKNIPKIAEVKLSSCGLEVADFKLRTLSCGLQKKL